MAYSEKTRQRAIDLYKGRSATRALKLLQKECDEAGTLDEKTIRRWRNDKLLKEHWELMASIATSLLSELEVTKRTMRGNQFDIFQYTIVNGDYGYGITRKQLESHVLANIERVSEKYWDTGWKFFKVHLSAELPEIGSKELKDFASATPYELIETLKILARTKKFKGICSVCKHLH